MKVQGEVCVLVEVIVLEVYDRKGLLLVLKSYTILIGSNLPW